jgi:hypothetical protein
MRRILLRIENPSAHAHNITAPISHCISMANAVGIGKCHFCSFEISRQNNLNFVNIFAFPNWKYFSDYEYGLDFNFCSEKEAKFEFYHIFHILH